MNALVSGLDWWTFGIGAVLVAAMGVLMVWPQSSITPTEGEQDPSPPGGAPENVGLHPD